MKELLAFNIPATIAVIGLCGYFIGMAIVFVCSPIKNAKAFSMQPVDNAGKTEIRVYYGGISFALGAFLGYLFITGHQVEALVGGLYFSNTVFFTRFIFTFVDKGWKCAYTKLAIPAEGLFIVALWTCYILSQVLY